MVFLEQSLLGPTSCLEPKRGDLENFDSSTVIPLKLAILEAQKMTANLETSNLGATLCSEGCKWLMSTFWDFFLS